MVAAVALKSSAFQPRNLPASAASDVIDSHF
jgi:hypothetical protein